MWRCLKKTPLLPSPSPAENKLFGLGAVVKFEVVAIRLLWFSMCSFFEKFTLKFAFLTSVEKKDLDLKKWM
jgi:hypothetical protein